MATRPTQPSMTRRMSRRRLLQSGLAAGATLATWPLYQHDAVRGAEAGPPKRGGMLRARGWDPGHFDPHVTRNFKSHTALSFVYSKLLRHKVGPDVPPGTFIVEPDLAERWESPDTRCKHGAGSNNRALQAMVIHSGGEEVTYEKDGRTAVHVEYRYLVECAACWGFLGAASGRL